LRSPLRVSGVVIDDGRAFFLGHVAVTVAVAVVVVVRRRVIRHVWVAKVNETALGQRVGRLGLVPCVSSVEELGKSDGAFPESERGSVLLV